MHKAIFFIIIASAALMLGPAKAASIYDGEWVGEVNLESGGPHCYKKIKLSGIIEEGELELSGTVSGSPIVFKGLIDSDGKVEGKVVLRSIVRRAVALGQFVEDEIIGTWTAKDQCLWNFVLARPEDWAKKQEANEA